MEFVRVDLIRGGPNNFHAIRLLMALLVVWSHSFALHLGSEDGEWVSLALHGVYNAGNLGVMAFFAISGFLITQSWDRSKTARGYFERRVRRIYPGFIVCTFLCAFVIGPLFGGPIPNPLKTLGLTLLLQKAIPDAFWANHSHAVNGSLWSIPFEFWCYIGVGVAGTFLLRRRWWLVAICAALMLGRIASDLTGKTPMFGPIGYIVGWPYTWTLVGPSFLLGMIAYSFTIPRSRLLLVALIGAAILGCWISRFAGFLLVAPALAYAVFYAAYSKRVQLHWAEDYGDFSYGCYLYAFAIQQVLQATTSLTLPEFIGVSMVLSLIAGALSWFIVERSFQRAKQRQPATALAW